MPYTTSFQTWLTGVLVAFTLGGGPLLGLVSAAQAQDATDALFFSRRLPATGPRLTAVGGASVAGVGDVGAFFTNPSGLSLIDASQGTGAFRALAVTDEGAYETFGVDGQSFGTNATERSLTGYGIGNVGLLYKVPTEQGALVLGAALNETRHFGRNLDFRNRNGLSSVSDFFLPLNDEVDVQRFAPGNGPDELLFGQELIPTDDAEFLVDFDPDGDGQINRPLSFIAFQTFGIDLVPSFFEPGGNDAEAFLPVVTPGTEFQQVGDIREEGTLRELNFGGSVEAAQDVHVGVSANVTFGTYDLRDTFEEIDDADENDGTDGTVDFRSLRLTRTLNSDLSGFNLRAGLNAQVAPQVRVGLAFETPTWYSIDEESGIRLATNFDNGDRFVYGDQASEDVGRTTFDYTVRTPWRISGGLALEVDPLRVLVDAEFVDWTGLELDSDVSGLFDVENDLIEDVFDPVVNTRVGAEYEIDALTLRAGVAYQPAPASLSEIDEEAFGGGLNLRGADAVDERTRLYYSAGIGYALSEQVRVDLSWMQQRFEDRTLPYTSTNASFVNEEVRRNQVLIGLRYRF